jgi:hypothetical protein
MADSASRFPLGSRPTPLEEAPRLAAAIGLEPGDLWIKRDDLGGLGPAPAVAGSEDGHPAEAHVQQRARPVGRRTRPAGDGAPRSAAWNAPAISGAKACTAEEYAGIPIAV